jgi:hypothetical protein
MRLGMEGCGGLGGHGQRKFVELIGGVSELRSRGFQLFIRSGWKRRWCWLTLGPTQQNRGRR